MADLPTRLSSRKFLLAAAAAVYAIVQAALGAITPDQALDMVKAAVLAYIAAEGAADAVTRFATAYYGTDETEPSTSSTGDTSSRDPRDTSSLQPRDASAGGA